MGAVFSKLIVTDGDADVDVEFSDHILTLSTCSNGHDQRLVIHAKLIKE